MTISTRRYSWRNCGQQGVGGLVVVVGEGPPPRAGQQRPLDDAVVRQGVVQHQVAGADEVADDRLVGGMSAHEAQGRLGAQEAGDRPLQLAVQVLLAGRQAAGRDAGAVAVDGLLGGLRHRRVARHPHVIVTGEVDQFAAADDGAVVGDPLVDAEKRIAHPRRRQQVQAAGGASRYSGKSSKR